MEDGWKWKHINRSTILYKLLHMFDKLLKKGILSMSALQNRQRKRKKKRKVSIGVKRIKSQEDKLEKNNKRETIIKFIIYRLEICSEVKVILEEGRRDKYKQRGKELQPQLVQ